MSKTELSEYIAEVLVENYELRKKTESQQKEIARLTYLAGKRRDRDAKTLKNVLSLLKQARVR